MSAQIGVTEGEDSDELQPKHAARRGHAYRTVTGLVQGRAAMLTMQNLRKSRVLIGGAGRKRSHCHQIGEIHGFIVGWTQ